jgi:small subunit ribosomal protein S20
MPQHKSAEKRIRQADRRRAQNRQHRSRMRTLIKKLRETAAPDEAGRLLQEIKAYLDRLAAKGIIHRNKAAHYKSQLEKRVKAL